MLIVEDNVEEVQLGYVSKWKHKLSLVEYTKRLELEIMPDSSITQSIEYNRSQHLNPPITGYDFGTNFFFSTYDTIYSNPLLNRQF